MVLRLILVNVVLVLLIFRGETLRAESPWYEGFEGPQTSWRPAGGDAHFQVLLHRRVGDEAFTGDGCERITISATGGTHVYFGHDVGWPRVIDELSPTVRVKSDRGGLQLLARIVLPRTKDARTGHPLVTFVHGSTYTDVGRWRQLRIDDVPQRLARQVRVLRAELGAHVDSGEAYVDGILLNVYGGPGTTNVWIDDLDIGGYVGASPGAAGWLAPAEEASLPPSSPSVSGVAWSGGGPVGTSGPDGRRIEMAGSVLMVDGRPTLPRVIQYQGESLEFLKRLGFNGVWLPEPAGPEILEEAEGVGIWLVCPPPTSSFPAEPVVPGSLLPLIGPRYRHVLAWDLGQRLSTGDVATTRRRAGQVRAADRQQERPLICRPESDLRKFSQDVDFLVIGRSPLGTSLELPDYGRWIRERPRLARPGTPIWTTVQTQPAPSIRRQWAGLGLDARPPSVSSEQIRLLVYTAVASGSRGLLFESHSPLDAADDAARGRAMALELLNLELTLAERWLAAGSLVDSIRGSVPEVTAGVLRTDRARLLIPIWLTPKAQFVPGQSAANRLSMKVPGVPEDYRAYLLYPGALEPLQRKRDTGGVRVTLDEFGLTSLVLLTAEPLVVDRLTRDAARIGPRAARLQRDLTSAKLQAVARVHRQLSARPGGPWQATTWLGAAERELQRCDGSLAAGDYATAYRLARRAARPVRLLERAHWQSAVGSLPSPVSSPLATSFATLPEHWQLAGQIASAEPGPNRLYGGDFEDLRWMLQAGWQHLQHPLPGVSAEAQWATVAAHSGRYGLRLAVRATEDDDWQTLVETPPSWIRSPAVPVETGQIVRIHGWARVPVPIQGSVDGLLIIDSLGGEALAERVGHTDGWREFTLYRVAADGGTLSLTFALSGVGEAWVDDVTIQPISLSGAGRLGPGLTGLPDARSW